MRSCGAVRWQAMRAIAAGIRAMIRQPPYGERPKNEQKNGSRSARGPVTNY